MQKLREGERYSGNCVVCSRLVVEILDDDGKTYVDPDPRGHIGIEYACACLVAADFDMVGPDVPMCYSCRQDRPTNEQGVEIAKLQWEMEKLKQ